jgi:hypothetical protein
MASPEALRAPGSSRLLRLAQMELAEFVTRGRQAAAKWLDRARPGARPLDPPIDAAALERVSAFRRAGAPAFFAGARDDAADALLQRLPCERRETVEAADELRRGRFDLLGYTRLEFGDPLDWWLDPVSGARSPRVHWSRIDPLDAGALGDSKVVWELGRLQWLVTLGRAYRITGDEAYAAEFARHTRDFIHCNPPGVGIHWASSLEVALRIVSWCWALHLFRRSPALDAALFASVREAVAAHARHVERYLSLYFSPNTHLTGEALGLVYAASVFPELPCAERWGALGHRLLCDESERQVHADGVYFEQSTCYQRYTLEIYLHFLLLSAAAGRGVPAQVGRRVERMLDALLALRRPDGSLPQIGDADGGWLLPLTRRAPGDARGVFAVAAVWFDRPDYAWAAGGPAPELAWLLGSAGLAELDALAPGPPRGGASRALADGGYAVMRSGWTPDAHQLVLDAGPLGCRVSAGHGHADLLGVQCAAFGEAYLVDPGTYAYADRPWRDFFRGTAAHSTVMVDGLDQAEPDRTFSWRRRPRATLREWTSDEALDFADAEHAAYARLADPVRHRRRVLFVKPRYWVVVDDLDGAAPHRVELRFQFAPLEVALDDGWVRARGRAGRGLLLRAFASAPLRAEIRCGRQHPREGWYSGDYGRRTPAPAAVFSADTRLPLRLVTLIWPVEDAAAPPPRAWPVTSRHSALAGLVLDRGERVVLERDAIRHVAAPAEAGCAR